MPNMLDIDTRFSHQPQANIERSIIPRKCDLKTTFDFGELIPIYLDEVLPGQSSKMSVGSLVRMSTPKYPVMDTAYLDVYAFFVPNRLVWNHWKEFMGENKDSAWVSEEVYSIPSVDIEANDLGDFSLFDYYGLPTTVVYDQDYFISALPFRGYNLIWNEWFRDQNYQNAIPFNDGDADTETYKLLYVNKLHDIFTSITPEPQKGESVSLLFNGGKAPVYTTLDYPTSADEYIEAWEKFNGASWNDAESVRSYFGVNGSGLVTYNNRIVSADVDYDGTVDNKIQFSNLAADLSAATISTINQLRNAIVVQQYLETLARGGSRYTEIIRSLFGVISPDARLQRPELLGHIRLDLNMQQVVQTSFNIGEFVGENLPIGNLGNTGGMSKTTGYGFLYDKSFTEHGYIHIFACARTELSYQQGIDKHWRRKAVTDFYNPLFANIGNQPIPYYMIYASGQVSKDDEVFGYNEAWAEYRFKPNKITGAFRSGNQESLDSWHYGQFFTMRPIANSSFMRQSQDVVSRSLIYDGDHQQLLANFLFDEIATLPMPVYSIPGLDVL